LLTDSNDILIIIRFRIILFDAACSRDKQLDILPDNYLWLL